MKIQNQNWDSLNDKLWRQVGVYNQEFRDQFWLYFYECGWCVISDVLDDQMYDRLK